MNPFAALGVAPQLVSALERQGIAEPFPIQAMTLLDSLAGRDVCGQARTGSGKTLAFSLPLAQRLKPGASDKPRGLVLVPTRELAVQVNAVLRPLAKAVGLRVVPVYGGVSMEPQKTAARRGVDIIVATPGRLIDLDRQGFVKLDEVEIAVIDEADRMADMGFLPQVEHLLRRFRDRRPQYMLFSATLDGQVGRLVRSYLNDPVRHEVAPEPQAEVEMTHRFLAVHHLDRVLVAAAIARSAERTLVFVRTKRGADRLARQLVRTNTRVRSADRAMAAATRTRSR